jgi:hypothetical protein
MTVRKNIRDSEPDRDKNMAEISKVCGREMKFEPDFEYALWLFFFFFSVFFFLFFFFLSVLSFHVIFPRFSSTLFASFYSKHFAGQISTCSREEDRRELATFTTRNCSLPFLKCMHFRPCTPPHITTLISHTHSHYSHSHYPFPNTHSIPTPKTPNSAHTTLTRHVPYITRNPPDHL